MSNRNIAIGGGIPADWSPRLGIALGERAEKEAFSRSREVSFIVSALAEKFSDRFVLPQGADGDSIDLVAPATELSDWEVRDQGRRATCTAFAVAAMEELWRFTFGGESTLPDLSEEFLYYKSRNKGFSEVGIDLPQGEVDALTRSGATFLKQAKVALEEFGVSLEQEAPYNLSAQVNGRIEPATNAVSSAARRKPSTAFVHNIVDSRNGGATVGVSRAWETPLSTDTRVSDIIRDAISEDLAVAAGFAVLNGPGQGTWLGTTPFLTGHVKYPSDTVAAGLSPIGGHAVCMVGFVAENADEAVTPANPGWFIFRNSLGPYRFARDANITARPPASSLPGYGLISAADVDRYCWEYLFRERPH